MGPRVLTPPGGPEPPGVTLPVIVCPVCSAVPSLEIFRDFSPLLRCLCGRLSVARNTSFFRGHGKVVRDRPSFPEDAVPFPEDDVSRVVQEAVAHEVLES